MDVAVEFGVLIGEDNTELAMYVVSKVQGISWCFCGFMQWKLVTVSENYSTVPTFTCQTRRHVELNSVIHCVNQ